MKLSRSQRHKCYKFALKFINFDEIFLCYLLSSALRAEMNMVIIPKEIPDLFPEFKNRKPDDHKLYMGWWSMTDIDSRIKVLHACIRETAPKKYSRQSKKSKIKIWKQSNYR